jgi:hypothetical protein
MKRVSVEIDCARRATRVADALQLGRRFRPEFNERPISLLWRPVEGSPLRTDLLETACSGRRPETTLKNMPEAAASVGQMPK